MAETVLPPTGGQEIRWTDESTHIYNFKYNNAP